MFTSVGLLVCCVDLPTCGAANASKSRPMNANAITTRVNSREVRRQPCKRFHSLATKMRRHAETEDSAARVAAPLEVAVPFALLPPLPPLLLLLLPLLRRGAEGAFSVAPLAALLLADAAWFPFSMSTKNTSEVHWRYRSWAKKPDCAKKQV